MTEENKLICVKCGSYVVTEDRAMAYRPPIPPWVLESSARFVATCSNRNQATGREHGIGDGRTADEALAAFAKDQEWGMSHLERLAELEEVVRNLDVAKEMVRLRGTEYALRKKVAKSRRNS